MKYLIAAGFLACIPISNYLIANVGAKCVPGGPCLIPVGFGMMSPSGVLVIGAALVLRDAVQSTLGRAWAAALIVLGAGLSAGIAPPALAVASGVAFLLSEAADMAVYTPLREKRLWLAVLASGLVGSIVDSAVFLWLAFGSLDYVVGNVVGKLWASLIAATVLAALRYRRAVA